MNNRLLQTLSLFLILTLAFGQQSANFRPIIGIVSVPSEFPDAHDPDTYSNIHGSAVSFLESGGARVVPIPWDTTDDHLSDLLSSVNGILIGGDEAKLYTKNLFGHRKATSYTKRIKTILNYAVEANKNGTYYPVLGINVGFAVIPALLSGDLGIIEELDFIASNGLQSHPITLKNESSRLFSLFTPYQLNYMTKHNVLGFNNAYGVKAMSFESNEKLKHLFNVVATYKHNMFNEYVAAAEAVDLPIYITQFSPQLGRYVRDASFEVNYIANIASTALTNFFANETRSNPNAFSSGDSEDANLIYQYQPEFMGPTAPRIFFFTPSEGQGVNNE